MAKDELPAPAHVLLAYAADGWAVQNGQLSPAGKPRHPKAEIWLPIARALLRQPDGLERLRDLALAGMAAWGVDPSIVACVSSAFASFNFTLLASRQLSPSRFEHTAGRPVAKSPAFGKPRTAAPPSFNANRTPKL